MVLVGRPTDDPEWDEVIRWFVKLLTKTRLLIEKYRVFAPKLFTHRRGSFLALACGISYGGGQRKPGNLVYSRRARRIFNVLLNNKDIKRIAGFQSSAFATLAPKCYKISQTTYPPPYPSICGPSNECISHLDYGNAGQLFCSITAAGDFDHLTGGQFVAHDLKLIILFPSGFTIMLPSASVSHGNTPIAPGETRCSVAQYCAGSLLRWVEYGFRSAKLLASTEQGAADKKLLDGGGKERWEWALRLFSKSSELLEDYLHPKPVERFHPKGFK
ncbi:hypothetical protein C8J56DRAFT_1067459 [Mycena floridula]|nr:hypothetical protein C8J56DRAFT_1067459 [Mycena floridula]